MRIAFPPLIWAVTKKQFFFFMQVILNLANAFEDHNVFWQCPPPTYLIKHMIQIDITSTNSSYLWKVFSNLLKLITIWSDDNAKHCHKRTHRTLCLCISSNCESSFWVQSFIKLITYCNSAVATLLLLAKQNTLDNAFNMNKAHCNALLVATQHGWAFNE